MKMDAISIGDGPGGNYEAKVLKLIEENPKLMCGLADIDIRHDNWCAVYGGHPCNCDPDVKVRGEK